MSLPLIQISDLSRYYKEGIQTHLVLSGICLSIQAGETIALLGRSGSGKSTLLNLISGIDQPDSGSISIDGIEITRLLETPRTLFRRQNIGFIYQFFNLIPTLTALENVALVSELNNLSSRDAKEKARTMISTVGLGNRLDTFPDQLSGGEQQRIAVARALIQKPKLILADEPTGNLDAEIGQQILELLLALVKEHNSTLVIVTHSLAVAKQADRVLTLENGLLSEQQGEFAW
jgi:putative ABC transport system ATP-binding protein